jgi:predicted lipoprotein with Yx(FWY)xxD motif
MRKFYLILIIVLVAAVGGVLVWMNYRNQNPSPSVVLANTNLPTNQPTSNPSTPVENIKIFTLNTAANSKLGVRLISSNGMSLYRFTRDTPGVSNCSGSCAVSWPPYTVAPGVTLAGSDLVTGKIGTITRNDGTLQVTYNGMPLYLWHDDERPGDVNGDGVNGVWFAVKP